MKYLALVSLVFFCFIGAAQCLTCFEGEEWFHDFVKSAGGSYNQCSEGENYCLRMESTGTQFGFPVNVTGMMCATEEVCDNPSCHEISSRILQMTSDYNSEGSDDVQDLGSDEFDDHLFLFKLKDCEVACCRDDDCNFQPISTIRRFNPPSRDVQAITEGALGTSSSETGGDFATTEQVPVQNRFSPRATSVANNEETTISETATQGARSTKAAFHLLVSSLSISLIILFLSP